MLVSCWLGAVCWSGIYTCGLGDFSLAKYTTGTFTNMARGNQRDLARAKNQKKQQEAAKSAKKTGDPAKRMESDAEKMRRKQAEGMIQVS